MNDTEPTTGIRKAFKRVLQVGFWFFLLKGLAWLALAALIWLGFFQS